MIEWNASEKKLMSWVRHECICVSNMEHGKEKGNEVECIRKNANELSLTWEWICVSSVEHQSGVIWRKGQPIGTYWKKPWWVESNMVRLEGRYEIWWMDVMVLEWSGQTRLVCVVYRNTNTDSLALLAQTRSDHPDVIKVDGESHLRGAK